MKPMYIATLLLLICYISGAQPFSHNSHTTAGTVSVDFVTFGSYLTSAVWFSTIMPAYLPGYRYNFITGKNNCHRLNVNFRYFDSNTFTLNSVDLDPGEMRILQLGLDAEYIRYLPFTPYFSFLTGCVVVPEYHYFGRVAAPDQTHVLENYLVNLGPVFGFSFYRMDFFEIATLFILQGGFPLSGEIMYPDATTRAIDMYSIKMIGKLKAEVLISMFVIGVAYQYTLANSLFIVNRDEGFIPDSSEIKHTHSLVFTIGVDF